MKTYNSTFIKAWDANTGEIKYFSSMASCRFEYGIRYDNTLQKYLDEGSTGPDGKTFFDLPTDYEMELIRKGQILLV